MVKFGTVGASVAVSIYLPSRDDPSRPTTAARCRLPPQRSLAALLTAVPYRSLHGEPPSPFSAGQGVAVSGVHSRA